MTIRHELPAVSLAASQQTSADWATVVAWAVLGLVLAVAAVGIIVVMFLVLKKAVFKDWPFLPDRSPVTDLYLAAALNGGGMHVLEVALVKLALEDLISVTPDHVLTAKDGSGSVGIEAALLGEIRGGTKVEFGDLAPRMIDSPFLKELHTALRDRGFITSPGRAVSRSRLRTRRGTRALAYARRRGPENLHDSFGRPVGAAVGGVALGSSADLPDRALGEAIFGNHWRSEAGFHVYGDWGRPYGWPIELPGTSVSVPGAGG